MTVTLVIGFLAAIYALTYLVLPRLPLPVFVTAYVLRPMLWGLLALAVWRLPGYRTAGKWKEKSTIIALAAFTGFIQVVAYNIGGLFSSFGKNPASLTLMGIITNVFFVGAMLLGTELSRAWLVNRMGKRYSTLSLVFVTILYTLLAIPLTQLAGFKLQIETANTVISNWLPLLGESLLASSLARLSGASASLAYRAIPAAFWWFCPIIPDLPWSLKGLIGAVWPVAGLAVVSNFHAVEANRGKSRRLARQASFPTGWIMTASFCIVMVWFAQGVFPFKPSVIVSGSMVPVFEIGDVVIVAKTSAATIKPGDIIQYQKMEGKQKINIMHRVIKIEQSGDTKAFITKGDANSTADSDPVPPENVVGKVIMKIPKIGQISVFLKQGFTG